MEKKNYNRDKYNNEYDFFPKQIVVCMLNI